MSAAESTCEGYCDGYQHEGETIRVTVEGFGKDPIEFDYCEKAIAIDREAGFEVVPV